MHNSLLLAHFDHPLVTSIILYLTVVTSLTIVTTLDHNVFRRNLQLPNVYFPQYFLRLPL